jgi:hypothetical protein
LTTEKNSFKREKREKMKTNKTKICVSAVIMTVLLILLTYLAQLYAMVKAGDRSVAPVMALGIFILAGVIVVVVPAIVFIINRFSEWFSKAGIGMTGAVTYILFTVCMLAVFPFIKVPYSMIPSAEMGAGYVTLLIQLFTIIPAVICALISLVYMLSKKNS